MASDYWNGLNARQRAGLIAGVLLVVLAAFGLGTWLLYDPYTVFAGGLRNDQLGELLRELERAKISYRVTASGDSVSVPQSQLGKAHLAMDGADGGVPASVGLEMFKDTDFSATDFTQRINYQRALQGELQRTIQGIAGVRSARAHVILAEGGLFKRASAKATAAVTVTMEPGRALSQVQVKGIQRLVAASVPEIRIEDVVVLDASGASLTRPASDADTGTSSAQLELKREADAYLEGKLQRLLQDLVPEGTASLSVDTVLDDRQLRVTLEEPVGARSGRDPEHPTGVLVKEHLTQRGRTAGLTQTVANDDVEGDSRDSEQEFAVGRRMEQTLSTPGAIKRVSVAVALQGAPENLSSPVVEQLVANAVGIDRARGDSVSILLLPRSAPGSQVAKVASPAAATHPASAQDPPATHTAVWGILGCIVAILIGAIFIRLRERTTDVDVADATAKIHQWLNEGARSGRV